MSLQLHIFGEQHSDLPEHAPCGFVRHSSFPLNLFCRDSASSGTHQIHRLKPNAERRSALLEDGSNERVNVMSAPITRICHASGDAVVLARLFACLTVNHAVRPAGLLDLL